MNEKRDRSSRLQSYGVAAAATVGAGLVASSASADLVTLPVAINSNSSVETFINILGFVAGASTISVATATSAFSQANPMAPYSELMLRGNVGLAQLRAQGNGAYAAVIPDPGGPGGGLQYAVNVGAPFAFPTYGAGTYFDGGPYNTNGPAPLMWNNTAGVGQFAPPGGVYHFKFRNDLDGLTYDGWASVDTTVTGSPTITALHVDTLPGPGSLALLCMGAAGLTGYRRKRSA